VISDMIKDVIIRETLAKGQGRRPSSDRSRLVAAVAWNWALPSILRNSVLLPRPHVPSNTDIAEIVEHGARQKLAIQVE